METKQLEKIDHGGIFGTLSQLGHEQVVFCHDEPTGLKAIIARYGQPTNKNMEILK